MIVRNGKNEGGDVMKLIPLGDYYVWYCDWCDSRNLTLWTRIDAKALACGACCASHTICPPSTFEPGLSVA